MIKILAVCVGNICRSPALEAYLKTMLPSAYIDSAGISASFCGAGADRHMVAEGKKRGLTIAHTSRPVEGGDFHTFDYIVAVTEDVRDWLEEKKPPGSHAKILFHQKIDDPYRGGEEQVETVFRQIEETAKWVVDSVAKGG